jgi:hypothetical protein
MSVAPIELAHFWNKAKVGARGDCWEWQGATRGSGYGVFRKVSSHRFAYQAHRGDIPDGLMVRHMCGNKLCVNPAHLETGTAQDNMDDRRRLGEVMPTQGNCNPGEANGRSKITEATALHIIGNPDNLTCTQLAAKFSVSKATVTLIQQGKRWAHLQEQPA